MKTRKMMRRIFFIVAIVGFIYACSSPKRAVQVNRTDDVVAAEDSVEYDVETFDGRFETWYEFYKSPAMYRSQAYYENWNRQYVAEWNYKCMHPGKGWNFDPVVGYDQSEDYGFELNHKLFYYFMYVENVLKLKILPNGPTVQPR